MTKKEPDIAEDLRRGIRRVQIGLGVLTAVIVIGLVVLYFKFSDVNNSLCTFRNDLQARAIGSQDFLDHPNKYPGIKVPRSVVEQQLVQQQKTITALSSLNCD